MIHTPTTRHTLDGLELMVTVHRADSQSQVGATNHFIYRLTITNRRDRRIQILRRRWDIIDSQGNREIDDMDGVNGRRPIIAPNESHSYQSISCLEDDWGTMDGRLLCRDSAGDTFVISIPPPLPTTDSAYSPRH